jgi:hypothetical protein
VRFPQFTDQNNSRRSSADSRRNNRPLDVGAAARRGRRGTIPRDRDRCRGCPVHCFRSACTQTRKAITKGRLKRDCVKSKRDRVLGCSLRMISAQTPCVCREGKPVPNFRIMRQHVISAHLTLHIGVGNGIPFGSEWSPVSDFQHLRTIAAGSLKNQSPRVACRCVRLGYSIEVRSWGEARCPSSIDSQKCCMA